MFGQNPIREVERDPASLAVQEIFYTIQGEGPYAGMAATFVRLAGCNLACTFCDTDFESKIDNRMTVKDIAQAIHSASLRGISTPGHLVVITGGEPLRQKIVGLVELLTTAGCLVQIETAGTLWDHDLDPFVKTGRLVIVCSPKTPSINAGVYRNCHHYKYIITAGETDVHDGLPSQGTQTRNAHLHQTLFRPWKVTDGSQVDSCIWVSPCEPSAALPGHDAIWAANSAEAARVAMQYNYRLSLQMHKLVGVP